MNVQIAILSVASAVTVRDGILYAGTVGTDLAPPPLPPASVPVWRALLAGGLAGVISRTATAPLEKIKILAQVSVFPWQHHTRIYPPSVRASRFGYHSLSLSLSLSYSPCSVSPMLYFFLVIRPVLLEMLLHCPRLRECYGQKHGEVSLLAMELTASGCYLLPPLSAWPIPTWQRLASACRWFKETARKNCWLYLMSKNSKPLFENVCGVNNHVKLFCKI